MAGEISGVETEGKLIPEPEPLPTEDAPERVTDDTGGGDVFGLGSEDRVIDVDGGDGVGVEATETGCDGVGEAMAGRLGRLGREGCATAGLGGAEEVTVGCDGLDGKDGCRMAGCGG